MVRQSLGEDAIIVATREENGGKSVRVTAAVEQHDDFADTYARHGLDDDEMRGGPNFEIDTVSAGDDQGDNWLQYDEDEIEGAVTEKLTDVMLRHSVTDEITDQVISCATVLGQDQPDIALTAALEHLFSFRPLSQKPVGTACMLVGPPGSGKTLVAAKLAARSVMAGERVAVITTDTVRAGGVEQLSAFTHLMNVNLIKASGPKQLRDCLERVKGADRIFIDTMGTNPFNPEEMRNLARFAATGDVEPILVMPAGMDADESGEIARVYATLGVRSFVPTRVDIARRLGGLLAAAHHGGMIFAEAGMTPKVAEGLTPLTPKRLAYLLMPEAARSAASNKSLSPETGIRTGKQPIKAG